MLLVTPKDRDVVKQWKGTADGKRKNDPSGSQTVYTVDSFIPTNTTTYTTPPVHRVEAIDLKKHVSSEYRAYAIRLLASSITNAILTVPTDLTLPVKIAIRMEAGIGVYSVGKEQAYKRKLGFILRLIENTHAAPIKHGLDPIRLPLVEERILLSRYGLGATEYTRATVHKLERTVESTQNFFRGKAVSEVVQGTCFFCGGKNLIVVRIQTRSADEGATPFYFCSSCGKQQHVSGGGE